MKVFDFVLMLPEGHKQLNAMNVKYEEICGGSGPLFGTRCKEYTILGIHIMGSGPLLESCRPQLGVHKMAHQNPWECHFVHPQGAKKMVPVRNEAHHVDWNDLDVYKMV